MRFSLSWRDRLGLFKGGSRSGGAGGTGGAGGGGSAAAQEPTAAPTERQPPTLPEGVRIIRDDGFTRSYRFDAAGLPVTIYVAEGNVGFTVNGDYSRSSANRLTPEQSGVVAVKLRRIIRADAATRPDGFKYDTNAVTGDGDGSKRALAYEGAGFSRPVAGRAGGTQYGIVKNGKIVPDTKSLSKKEGASGVSQPQAERNYQSMVAERATQKAARRQQ
jgi:hypothetical protein